MGRKWCMKRFLTSILAFLVATSAIFSLPFAQAAEPNLVPNPSVETAETATKPSQWTSNKWGSNSATFSYLTSGRTGSRSVKTEVTNYVDGDAKWYFNAVAVQTGKEYNYTDYYQSNVETQVVAQYLDAANNPSYQWLGSLPASSTWAQGSFTFTVPASVAKVSIFHVVNTNGWLVLDDAELAATVTSIPQPGTNLVTNPSLQTGNAADTAPAGWLQNKWGANTAKFTYVKNGGYQSTRSVRVDISNYQSGDAKWYFTAVSAKPNTTYTFSDYYKSSVATRTVAVSYDANNVPTYIDLAASIPASSSWKKTTATFKTPASTKKLSVFHVIEKNGWLQTDTFSLVEEQPVIDTDLVPNNSLERISTADPAMPDKWLKNSWGTNTPTFEYVNGGRTGNRSVKVTISNYQSGDAKWYFEPITNLERGKQYRFSTWYKTNTAPHVVAMFIKDDGTEKYFGLPQPFPSGTTDWQFYSDTFSVPVDAKAVSVFLFVASNGYVQTDDYHIELYQPTGFSRPLVSLTFDDGQEDNVATALPMLNSYGFKSTQCYATDHIEGNTGQVQNVLAFKNSGHEICSHTVSHPFLTSLGATQLTYELQHSKQFLESIIGGPVRNFASPYGDYNAAVNAEIAKYYRSHRTVDEGYNSKDNFNIYRLRVQNVQYNTTLAEFQSWLDRAKADKTWLILVYHRVANNPGQFDTYVSDFSQQLQAIQQSGLNVKTYNAALDELVPQL